MIAVRPALAAGVALLVAAPLLALAPDAGARAALVAIAGLLCAWHGAALWYLPPFAKRAVLAERVALAPVALAAVAALALGASAWDARADRAGRALLGLAALASAAQLAASATWGRAWRGGVPSWRRAGPHRRADALALLLAATALAGLAAMGILLLLPPRGLSSATLALGAAGFAAPALAAFLAFLLPRGAKRPLGAPALAAGAMLAAAGAAGVAALAWTFEAPLDGPPLAVGLALAGASLATLGAFAIVEPLRARPAGPLLAVARPWLLAGGVALVAAGALALAASRRVDLLPSALVAALAGLALLHAGVASLAWPVLANATPRGAAWSLAGGALALAGLAALALSPALAAVILALAALAHTAQAEPLRRPRRECPPSEASEA